MFDMANILFIIQIQQSKYPGLFIRGLILTKLEIHSRPAQPNSLEKTHDNHNR